MAVEAVFDPWITLPLPIWTTVNVRSEPEADELTWSMWIVFVCADADEATKTATKSPMENLQMEFHRVRRIFFIRAFIMPNPFPQITTKRWIDSLSL
jgi:hypothetical protein